MTDLVPDFGLGPATGQPAQQQVRSANHRSSCRCRRRRSKRRPPPKSCQSTDPIDGCPAQARTRFAEPPAAASQRRATSASPSRSAVAEMPIAAKSTRDSFVALPPIQPGRSPLPLRNQGTPIVPRRLPLPSVENLPPPPPCAEAAQRLRQRLVVILAQFDAETRSGTDDAGRNARLLLAAAMQAEALHENSEAIDRYRRALDLAPNNRTALRRSAVCCKSRPTAQPDEAAMLIEARAKTEQPNERLGLLFQRMELLRAAGQLGDVKALAQDFLSSISRAQSQNKVRASRCWPRAM